MHIRTPMVENAPQSIQHRYVFSEAAFTKHATKQQAPSPSFITPITSLSPPPTSKSKSIWSPYPRGLPTYRKLSCMNYNIVRYKNPSSLVPVPVDDALADDTILTVSRITTPGGGIPGGGCYNSKNRSFLLATLPIATCPALRRRHATPIAKKDESVKIPLQGVYVAQSNNVG